MQEENHKLRSVRQDMNGCHSMINKKKTLSDFNLCQRKTKTYSVTDEYINLKSLSKMI